MNKTIFTILETPRLILRHFSEADLEPFLAYRNDPEVAKYQTWESISEAEARAFIQEQKRLQPGVPGHGFQFAIELKEIGTLIGDCFLGVNAPETHQAEIGFTLARAYQGQGYALEAVSGMLDYAFANFALHRVIAMTDCENSASIALLQRLGLRREGHFIQNIWFKGKWADEYLYAILKDEWQQQQEQRAQSESILSSKARLELSPEEMRQWGHWVVDMLVEHFTELPGKTVTRKASRPDLEPRLREPLPEHGMDSAELWQQLEQDVFGNIMYLNHPRFFAFIPGPSNFISVMADALAAGFNVFAGTWMEASGPTQVELVTVDWLRQACGLPDTAGGLFVSGGSVANMTALTVARHIKLKDPNERAMIYCSTQTHSSVERGLRVLGFHSHQLRKIECDDQFRLDLTALRQAVKADRAAGALPFCVVANVGTTNTGAIDPLPALAEYCREEELWLHADGAYGAAAALCERGQKLLTGLGLVDSLALDPHKWLFQPYEIGCVLVKNSQWLKETFHILPEYMEDVQSQGREINFCDYGIQLTRGCRALKLWLSLKYFGRAAFGAAIERGFELAELVEATVAGLPHWEIITPAQLSIVNFRLAPPGLTADELNQLNRKLVEALITDGLAMITSTILRGQTVLRMCPLNPRTTAADIQETIQRLDELGRKLLR